MKFFAFLAYFCWTAPLAAQTTFEVFLTSTYDGAVTRSVVQEPANYSGGPTCLVIALHGMGGNAWSEIDLYGGAANNKGWLLASPDTHGENDPTGMNSLAARAMQQDVLDLLSYVQSNWNVDASRVYLTGESMGGMGSTMMAAKYPDYFAAAVDWFGPTDLVAAWNELWWGDFRANMIDEIGGNPSQFPWEYERRSVIHYARNLRTVPFAIGQGRFDFVVLPHHSTDLAAEISRFQPTAFAGIYWNNGAHFLFPGEAGQTLDWLGTHVHPGDPEVVVLKTDTDQNFWWVSVTATVDLAWRTVTALPDLPSNSLNLSVTNAAAVEVDITRAGLDAGQAMNVVFQQDTDSTFVLTDLNPSHAYTVERNGNVWNSYVWDPQSATLSITVSLNQAGSAPFLIY